MCIAPEIGLNTSLKQLDLPKSPTRKSQTNQIYQNEIRMHIIQSVCVCAKLIRSHNMLSVIAFSCAVLLCMCMNLLQWNGDRTLKACENYAKICQWCWCNGMLCLCTCHWAARTYKLCAHRTPSYTHLCCRSAVVRWVYSRFSHLAALLSYSHDTPLPPPPSSSSLLPTINGIATI